MKIRGFEVITQDKRKFPNQEITLPTRGSATSAGYDFYSNEEVVIKAGDKHVFWTDVKAYMQPGEVLYIYVRSSIGIKKLLRLANQVGVIDADYYSNESNDGNIGICLVNTTKEHIVIPKGERIAQGVFMPFLESDNGNTDKERTGGIGSTNK